MLVNRTLAMIAVVMATVSTAPGATVAYWQFDEGTPGNDATTVVTQVNSPALDGTGVNDGGGLPDFSSEVPFGTVYSSGSVVNASNTGALSINNTGLPGNVGSHSTGVIQVDGSNALVKQTTFTIELFVKFDLFAEFAGIIGKERNDNSGCSWQIDTDGTGKLRVRFDTQALGTGGNGVSGYNQSWTSNFVITDGQWHHVALTYDETNRTFALFADYAQQATDQTAFNLVYDDDVFEIGHIAGRGFDGWVDEVRLSDTILAPSQFLAIPEPASLTLLAPALLMITRRRR